MNQKNVEAHAKALVDNLHDFHSDAIARGEGTEEFNAVVIKSVALCVLVYGLPVSSDDDEIDFEEALVKLMWANSVLMKETDGTTIN